MNENSCNCDTCPNWDNFFHGCKLTFYETPIQGEKTNIHPWMTPEAKWSIKQVGCLSHPKVRECLMKDVIEVMERRKTNLNLALDRPILGTQMQYQNLAVMEEKVEMLDGTINLIKNGVEKK
jgi:hypothetical protein